MQVGPSLPDPSLALSAVRPGPGRAEKLAEFLGAGKRTTAEDIRAAAEDYEAVVISQFVQVMFEGIETGGPFGGGHGEAMFRSLLIDEYSKAMVGSGGLGLADHVQAELLRLQEGAAPSRAAAPALASPGSAEKPVP